MLTVVQVEEGHLGSLLRRQQQLVFVLVRYFFLLNTRSSKAPRMHRRVGGRHGVDGCFLHEPFLLGLDLHLAYEVRKSKFDDFCLWLLWLGFLDFKGRFGSMELWHFLARQFVGQFLVDEEEVVCALA